MKLTEKRSVFVMLSINLTTQYLKILILLRRSRKKLIDIGTYMVEHVVSIHKLIS